MEQSSTGVHESYPDADPSLMLELARDRLAVQIMSVDALDGKFGGVLGWASGLALITAGVGLFHHALLTDPLGQFFLTLAGGFYILVLVLSFLGLAPRQWLGSPNLDQVWGDHNRLAPRYLQWRVAADFIAFWRQNEPAREAKAKRLFAAQVLLLAEGVAAVAALMSVMLKG